MPAFADDFPSNGYMLEDMVYEEAATHSNMGVYDGAVTATAEYEDILYQIGAGTYLPAGSEGDLETCPENSYCPGDVDVTYNETTDQGISSCPSGYPNSAAGASSNTQCYTACTVGMVEHASAVDGNDYYNTDADTCAATACEGGYHVEGSLDIVSKAPLAPSTGAASDGGNVNANGSIDTFFTFANNAEKYGLSEPNTWAVESDVGIYYGRASCQPALHDAALAYVLQNKTSVKNGSLPKADFQSNLAEMIGENKANYIVNQNVDSYFWVVAEQLFFENNDADSYGTTDTGQYCYCQMTGFTPSDSGQLNMIRDASWRYATDLGPQCADMCSTSCEVVFRSTNSVANRAVRDTIVDLYAVLESNRCSANEITINWTDAADEDIAANNAGMCTYGGDIRTPVAAMEKPGKTFVGWKFDVTE